MTGGASQQPSCASCRFYLASSGACRRNPPTALPNRTEWPKVAAADWCGEWRAQDRRKEGK